MIEVTIIKICRLSKKETARPLLVDLLNMSQSPWELGTCKPWNSNSIFKSISLFMEFTHSWVRKEILTNTQKIVLSPISKGEVPLLPLQHSSFSTTLWRTFKSPKKMQLSRLSSPRNGLLSWRKGCFISSKSSILWTASLLLSKFMIDTLRRIWKRAISSPKLITNKFQSKSRSRSKKKSLSPIIRTKDLSLSPIHAAKKISTTPSKTWTTTTLKEKNNP